MYIILVVAAVLLLAVTARTLIRDLWTDGRGHTPLPPRFGWDEHTKI